MSLAIKYTPCAQQTLIAVYEFISNKFGERAANKYKAQADKVIRLISRQPYMFKATTLDESIRIGLITKQSSVLYQVSEDTIILHAFWDNRQEPML